MKKKYIFFVVLKLKSKQFVLGCDSKYCRKVKPKKKLVVHNKNENKTSTHLSFEIPIVCANVLC